MRRHLMRSGGPFVRQTGDAPEGLRRVARQRGAARNSLCFRSPRAGVTAGGGPDDAPEMAAELALITEANQRRDLGGENATFQEPAGARDAQVSKVCMRGHSDLSTERPAQMEFVEPRMCRQVVKGDRVTEVLAQIGHGPPYGPRAVRSRALQQHERGDGFGYGNLEG